MIRVTCFLSGRVQGVGMRFRVNEIAAKFEVFGFVENLDDGRVRIVAEGNTSEIDRFLQTVQSISTGLIQRLERFDSAPSLEFTNFSIRR